MLFGVITLFPEMFQSITDYGVTKKSIQKGLVTIKLWNPRNFAQSLHKNVDDRPYGGGPGMLMMIQPLKDAIDQAKFELGSNTKVIYFSPQGKRLNQTMICNLVNSNENLILVCGRYQGIDERLIKMEVHEEWSIGDYILSGGELAAMVFIDSFIRLLPGTLRNCKSKESDSFFENKLDCPHYTRPKRFEGMEVPSVLLSGNHNNISRWRLKQSLGNTWIKRPDLLKKSQLTKKEEELLMEFKNEYLLLIQSGK